MARYRFMFWLDGSKDLEQWLKEHIEYMKSNRVFASTIRDSLRLIIDLRAGNLEVLFELFPWIQERMTPPPRSGDDDLKLQIAELKQMFMLGQGGAHIPKTDLYAVGIFPAAPKHSRALPPKPETAAPMIAPEAMNNSSENFFDQMLGF